MLTREGLTPDIAFGVISSEIGTNRSWWSLETVSGRSHSGQSFIIVFRRIDVYFEGMPRQVRIEFAGAMYHVMARGDHREAIVRDDKDRKTFLRTLGEACGRTGFRIHAYVLMGNHYHLLVETPQANLAKGMGWLQNAYTRRINTRHRLWGHLFGDRYKSILVEPGNCFWS